MVGSGDRLVVEQHHAGGVNLQHHTPALRWPLCAAGARRLDASHAAGGAAAAGAPHKGRGAPGQRPGGWRAAVTLGAVVTLILGMDTSGGSLPPRADGPASSLLPLQAQVWWLAVGHGRACMARDAPAPPQPRARLPSTRVRRGASTVAKASGTARQRPVTANRRGLASTSAPRRWGDGRPASTRPDKQCAHAAALLTSTALTGPCRCRVCWISLVRRWSVSSLFDRHAYVGDTARSTLTGAAVRVGRLDGPDHLCPRTCRAPGPACPCPGKRGAFLLLVHTVWRSRHRR
jgi:hypothetical protein